jgi:hypothetical protein
MARRRNTAKQDQDQMPQKPRHQCECKICQQPEAHPEKLRHYQMNLLMSRLDEQQRRWYAAVESERIGQGGDTQVSRITGLDVETIRRGRRELEKAFEGRPVDQIRLPGGGRKAVEKKTPISNKPS